VPAAEREKIVIAHCSTARRIATEICRERGLSHTDRERATGAALQALVAAVAESAQPNSPGFAVHAEARMKLAVLTLVERLEQSRAA
jgi:hypothetical protein